MPSLQFRYHMRQTIQQTSNMLIHITQGVDFANTKIGNIALPTSCKDVNLIQTNCIKNYTSNTLVGFTKQVL